MYLPISILAYLLNGGVLVVDKILLNTSYPNPWIYTFYINVLGLLSLLLLPLGFNFHSQAAVPAVLSGIATVLAMLCFFQSLKIGEASIAGPIVGALNPLFTFVIGAVLLKQVLNPGQLIGFLVILIGAGILTFNLWYKHLRANNQLFLMVLAGLFFAISYLFLKEVFNSSNFITGLILSRLVAGLTVLSFLFSGQIRRQIFMGKGPSLSPLLLFGQSMGAGAGLLLTYATSLAAPALVNSLFGIQYVVIFVAALVLSRKNPDLLDEGLSPGILAQKILGAGILSFGIYVLSLA